MKWGEIMKKRNAEMILLFLVALWGLSFSLMKPLLDSMGVFNLMTYRFMIGGYVILIYLLSKKPKTIDWNAVKSGIISGVLLFLVFYFHVGGLKYTSVAKNAFIVGSSVVFVPIILSVIYRERQSKTTIVQTGLALVGLMFITLSGKESGINNGDILTLIGTIIFAFYTIQIEKYMEKFDPLTFSAAQINTVGVLSLISMLLFETPVLRFSVSGWISILVLSVLLTGFAYALTNTMQKHVNAARVSLIYTMEPFFATLFGWFILSEQIGFNIIFGGLLMIGSIAMPYLIKGPQEEQLKTTL